MKKEEFDGELDEASHLAFYRVLRDLGYVVVPARTANVGMGAIKRQFKKIHLMRFEEDAKMPKFGEDTIIRAKISDDIAQLGLEIVTPPDGPLSASTEPITTEEWEWERRPYPPPNRNCYCCDTRAWIGCFDGQGNGRYICGTCEGKLAEDERLQQGKTEKLAAIRAS